MMEMQGFVFLHEFVLLKKKLKKKLRLLA